MAGGGGGRRGGARFAGALHRAAAPPTIPTFRRAARPPKFPKSRTPSRGSPRRVTDEQLRNPINIIPPAGRPRVVLRYANANELLVSGLLDNGAELARHAAVVDSPYGQGHVVLFSNNPFWRGETKGSYFLVFNAILNFDHLDAGKRPAAR